MTKTRITQIFNNATPLQAAGRAHCEYTFYVKRPAFALCAEAAFTPEVEQGDGYSLEIAHFVKAVSGQKVPEITTPAQSPNSIKLILTEKQSAQSGKEIAIE